MSVRMAGVSVQCIQSHLDRVLKYLQPHMHFVNCHMVGYLTDHLWRTFVPEDIRSDITDVADVDKAIDLFWKYQRDPDGFEIEHHKFQGFLRFLKNSRQHRLLASGGIASSVEQLNDHLHLLGYKLEDGNKLQIKEFMSEKKNHEVDFTAQVVATLCGTRNGEQDRLCVIDAGDGKGYLSSRLALEHRLHVLGIDANAGNTAGAQKRTAQLEVNLILKIYF